MAVQYEWGGPESGEKYEWLIDETVDLFSKRGTKIDLYDLQDFFDDILDAEFQMRTEDGSVDEVSNTLLRLFNECIHGKTTLLDQLKSLEFPPPAVPPQQPAQSSDDEVDVDELSDGLSDPLDEGQ